MAKTSEEHAETNCPDSFSVLPEILAQWSSARSHKLHFRSGVGSNPGVSQPLSRSDDATLFFC